MEDLGAFPHETLSEDYTMEEYRINEWLVWRFSGEWDDGVLRFVLLLGLLVWGRVVFGGWEGRNFWVQRGKRYRENFHFLGYNLKKRCYREIFFSETFYK